MTTAYREADPTLSEHRHGVPVEAPHERRSGRSRRPPAIVWSIFALHITVLLAYSLLAPTYRAPDEPLHVDLAHVFSEQLEYPAWDEGDTGVGILNSMGIVEFHTGSQHLEASAALHREDRPSIDELDERTRPQSINQLTQHPPLYYALAGGIERVAEVVTGDPIGAFDLEAWFYRLVSILLVAPLPLVIWSIGRQLRLPDPVTVAAMLFPLAVPNYLHIGSVANNDSLMILFFWLLTPLVLRLAHGEVGVRSGALAGLVTGLALYTKGFALVLPLWVVGALSVALRRLGRDQLRRVVLAGLAYVAVTMAAGGWWWVANLIRYGEPLPTRYHDLVQPIESDARNFRDFLETWSTITTRRFWGDFGWFDVHIPDVAVTAASVVVIVGIVVACTRRDRVAGTPVGDRLLLAAPFVLLVAAQFALALRAYISLGRMPGLQGRYWFGAIAALAIVVGLGLANLSRRTMRFLPFLILTAAVTMNALGVTAMLGHYWGAPGSSVTERLRAVVAWAPIEGEVIAVGALIGCVVLALAVVQVVTIAVRSNGDDEEPPLDEASHAPFTRVPVAAS
jgi:small subunit ribosomal protein S36